MRFIHLQCQHRQQELPSFHLYRSRNGSVCADWFVRGYESTNYPTNNKKSIKRSLESAEKDLPRLLAQIYYPIPVDLEPRVLSTGEIETLKNICLHEFSQCDQNTWNAYGTLQVIDDFVQFCRLLSKPENHVKTRSSQYIEKLVNSRTFIDMNHEMAHELIKLPRYTAYAKIIEERGGDQTVIAPKFRAQKPPSVPHGRNRDIRDRALELTHSFYCKERTQIEEELRHRQKNWRKRSATEGTPANKHSPPASA